MAEPLVTEEEIFTFRKKIKNVNDTMIRRSMSTSHGSLESLCEREDELGRAAVTLKNALKVFRYLLDKQCIDAAREYDETVTPFLEKLFNVSLSEPVTLPILGEHGAKTCRITGLNHISTNPSMTEVYGCVNVSSIDGRSHTSENFVVVNGKPYFQPEDLY